MHDNRDISPTAEKKLVNLSSSYCIPAISTDIFRNNIQG